MKKRSNVVVRATHTKALEYLIRVAPIRCWISLQRDEMGIEAIQYITVANQSSLMNRTSG